MKSATIALSLLTSGLLLAATDASAAQPEPWQMGLQPAATELMERLRGFEQYTLYIITGITVFVMVLLGICIFRFNARANPTPSKVSHNTTLEVIWTAIPVLILLAIAIPSFRLLFFQTDIPAADLTVKATGHSWYWQYTYPNEGMENIDITSVMVQEDQLAAFRDQYNLTAEQAPRLLAVDNPMVVPVGKVVRMLTTADGVNHAFAMPAFGIKKDAIVGRINETWFQVDRPGVYFGQCSELCGQNHAFMPITVVAVDEARFEEWVKAANESVGKATDLVYAWVAEDNGTTGDGQRVASATGAASEAAAE